MDFFKSGKKELKTEQFEIIETSWFITVKDVEAKIAGIENSSMEAFAKALKIQEEKSASTKERIISSS